MLKFRTTRDPGPQGENLDLGCESCTETGPEVKIVRAQLLSSFFLLKFPYPTLVCKCTPTHINIQRFVICTIDSIFRFRLKGIIKYEIFPQNYKMGIQKERLDFIQKIDGNAAEKPKASSQRIIRLREVRLYVQLLLFINCLVKTKFCMRTI